MRIVNYNYYVGQLQPSSRVPGFIFHQTERSADNGTNPCFSDAGPPWPQACYDNNIRDFDLLGYIYSLLSTVGTAGQNNVVTMVPARDPDEFNLLPQRDRDTISGWLSFTDENLDSLRNTKPIPTLNAPRLGSVDGTCAMNAQDEGYAFLYNPGMLDLNATLVLDESLCISNASVSSQWTVIEMYPQNRSLAVLQHGVSFTITVSGKDALVLAFRKVQQQVETGETLAVFGAAFEAVVEVPEDNIVKVQGLKGAPGESRSITVRRGRNSDRKIRPFDVVVNGKACGSTVYNPADDSAEVQLKFSGEVVRRAQPISADLPSRTFVGGWYNTTFTISQSMVDQLNQRAIDYPVNWTDAGLSVEEEGGEGGGGGGE